MIDEHLAVLGGPPVRAGGWPRWPQAAPSTHQALTEVLDSARWTVSGPYTGQACFERRFAAAFAAFHATPFCTPVSSGTAALTIALQAAGVGRGDEVLVPGLTWVACASAVISLGAVPVLVDVDPCSLTLSPDAARAACTAKTAAIMAVHLFCSVADLDALGRLSTDRGIPLIEDCAQAHGARWRDRPVGTFGTAGCFSMQQSKLLTSGEGGAVLTSDPDVHDRLEQLRCDGRRFSGDPRPGLLELEEAATVQGRNLCLSEFQAAVLLDGLQRLDEQNQVREDRAKLLESLLDDIDGVTVLPRDGRVTRRAYYNFVVRFAASAFGGATAEVIARALGAELGTAVNPVYVPLNRHRLLCPARIPPGNTSAEELARLDPGQYDLPAAERAWQECVTLTHAVLLASPGSMADIAEAIRKVQRRAGDLRSLPAEAGARSF